MKDFQLDYSALQKLRRVGQKIKLNRVQKLFQSMMSSVSGIQSGEETSINVLLRTPHFKEILTRHSNMHYKCSNALPELVSKHYFLILEFGKISDKQHLLLEIRK